MAKYYKADAAGNMTPFEGTGLIKNDETLTADKTLTVADSGKVFLIGTDGLTITLPATVAGLVYSFINIGADAGVGITISPDSDDAIEGAFCNKGQNIVLTGTDDKNLVNTKATAKTGDRLTLIGNGSGGWYVTDAIGVWTEESQTVEYSPVNTVSVDTTLTSLQSGETFLVDTDGKTITLPATAKGVIYTIINDGADAAVGITLSPNANDKLMGAFVNKGANITLSGTDNKNLVNTKATALNGDRITLIGDGADGWYVLGGVGIWTEEDQVASGPLKPYTLLTDNYSITQADAGGVFAIATDAKVITLPATVAGMEVTIVNVGADGNNIVTISPAAADGIFGTITLAASVVQMAGTADTDLINTKATALKGDCVTLVGDGVDGWFIKSITGIWASA